NYPRLDAGSTFTRGDGPVYAFASLLDQRSFGAENFDIGTLNHPGYVTNFKSYLRAGVPIFAGYELQSWGKMAELGVSHAESLASGARQEVRLAVLEAGIQTLQARALVDQLDDRIRFSSEEIDSAKKLRAKGLVLGSDFFAAEAVLSGLKAWRVQVRKMAEAGQDSLGVLLGSDPAGFDLAGSLRAGGPALPSLPDLIGLARVNRADVRASSLEAEQAEVSAFKERSTFLPRVDAMAQAETNTEDFSSNPSNRLVMVQAQWALGDPAYLARRKKAEDMSRAGRQRQAAMEERARIEIVQSLRRYEGARDAIPLLAETAEMAKQSLDLFRPLYREGRQSILDVLRAEEALARAESLRLEAMAQLHLQRARTLTAAGILDEGAVGALSAAVEK
ncbi:MAG: TolC family protein, partial [Elusimicrobia bacterium]|nr:TolC family protein [Elusimicrobiota bacterium]